MLLEDLLKVNLDTATLECWPRERTATVRAFAVRLLAANLLLKETEAVLQLLGVERSFQAIFPWIPRLADSVSDPPSARPRRVAVDENASKINGKWSRPYAAIDLYTKVLLDVTLFTHQGTDPVAAYLYGVCEKHDCAQALFLADIFSYQAASSRLGLNGRVGYTDGNQIEKWFHTLKIQVDRFHNSWVGSRMSVRQSLRCLSTTRIFNDRINRSTDAHQTRRLTRQCQ